MLVLKLRQTFLSLFVLIVFYLILVSSISYLKSHLSLCTSLIILYVVYMMFHGASLICVFLSPLPLQKMINGGIIDNWACVSFSRMRPEEVYRFCCDLIQMCNATGMVKSTFLSCFLGILSIQDKICLTFLYNPVVCQPKASC